MRTFTIAALLVSLGVAPIAADAQRIAGTTAGTTVIRSAPTVTTTTGGAWNQARAGNWNAPRPGQGGTWNGPRPGQGGNWNGSRPGQVRQPRWGGNVNGHWYAGMHAPGGWNAYRRPARGWTLPRYWIAPSFYIGDYTTYGLSTPPYGYSWSRYYDDAVLVDQRGRVWDSVGGIDWNRYDDGYYADGGYQDGGYYADGYAAGQSDYYSGQPQYQGQYRDRRDNGVGGAVIGGVVGAGAGYAIGGRGNRVAGSLIGAGVGAAAGYAIDKAEDRRRYDAPPPRDYYQEPGVSYAPPREVVQSGGYSTSSYSTDYQQGGYVSGGYWYPPTTRTVVTVGSAPIETTTTTTEYVETTYAAPRRVWKKKAAWKPRPKLRSCTCACACR